MPAVEVLEEGFLPAPVSSVEYVRGRGYLVPLLLDPPPPPEAFPDPVPPPPPVEEEEVAVTVLCL